MKEKPINFLGCAILSYTQNNYYVIRHYFSNNIRGGESEIIKEWTIFLN